MPDEQRKSKEYEVGYGKPPKSGQFKKGDPRINRKGKPKSFDALRELAQQLANEKALGADKQPIVYDGHVATQIEMILRTMMRENPERFVEISYGKVPTQIEIRDWRKAVQDAGMNPDEVLSDFEQVIASKMGNGTNGSGGDAESGDAPISRADSEASSQ